MYNLIKVCLYIKGNLGKSLSIIISTQQNIAGIGGAVHFQAVKSKNSFYKRKENI